MDRAFPVARNKAIIFRCVPFPIERRIGMHHSGYGNSFNISLTLQGDKIAWKCVIVGGNVQLCGDEGKLAHLKRAVEESLHSNAVTSKGQSCVFQTSAYTPSPINTVEQTATNYALEILTKLRAKDRYTSKISKSPSLSTGKSILLGFLPDIFCFSIML